jgi:hypothetical protein
MISKEQTIDTTMLGNESFVKQLSPSAAHVIYPSESMSAFKTIKESG